MSQIHTCTICQKRDTWRQTWAWYGSYAQLEGYQPGEIVKVCSEACRVAALERKLIPRNAPFLDESFKQAQQHNQLTMFGER